MAALVITYMTFITGCVVAAAAAALEDAVKSIGQGEQLGVGAWSQTVSAAADSEAATGSCICLCMHDEPAVRSPHHAYACES